MIEATFAKLGYPTANPKQLEAVKDFVKGKDVHTLTGSRKTLCYVSLPLVFNYLRSGSTRSDVYCCRKPSEGAHAGSGNM